MASSNNMIYTRVCVDCGKVMHNVGRRTERCPECRAVHIRVKALEASYRERTEQLIRQAGRAGRAIHQGLVDDNERFTASAGTYGKGRIKEIWPHKRKSSPLVLAHRQAARVDGFYRSHQPEDNTFSEVYKMEKIMLRFRAAFPVTAGLWAGTMSRKSSTS